MVYRHAERARQHAASSSSLLGRAHICSTIQLNLIDDGVICVQKKTYFPC